MEPATCSDSAQAMATPAMVTVCATQRGMTLQKMPAMIAATSGASGMASSRLGLRVSVTRSALQGAQIFDVDGATLAEQHHEDRETDGRLRGRHGEHEEHEDLPVDVAEEPRKRHEIEIHREQQQLDAHQQQDEVLAVDEHAGDRDREQHAGDGEQPVELDHGPVPFAAGCAGAAGLSASTFTMRTRSSRRTATCFAMSCCLRPVRLRIVREMAATIAMRSSTAASSNG